jgi:hypothetical protein
MKWSAVAAALVMAAAPIAAQSQQQSTTQAPAASTPRPQAASGAKLTLHGCVRAGVEKDTVLMTDVTE